MDRKKKEDEEERQKGGKATGPRRLEGRVGKRNGGKKRRDMEKGEMEGKIKVIEGARRTHWRRYHGKKLAEREKSRKIWTGRRKRQGKKEQWRQEREEGESPAATPKSFIVSLQQLLEEWVTAVSQLLLSQGQDLGILCRLAWGRSAQVSGLGSLIRQQPFPGQNPGKKAYPPGIMGCGKASLLFLLTIYSGVSLKERHAH